jgi:methylated-DNA-protein-cysteine methyltransferase-like protein
LGNGKLQRANSTNLTTFYPFWLFEFQVWNLFVLWNLEFDIFLSPYLSPMNTTYFEAVYDVVRVIPKGRVTTYGAIADFLALGSARMVGWALRQSFEEELPIPAHRVVNRVGELTGRLHFATPTLMAERLIAEGTLVEDNQVVEFKARYWHPREMEENDK